MILASRPYIIKASSKSNITVIKIDIWNSQNDTKTKSLINKHYSIE